jgi:4-amino-4-deoxy-L-arabinose transferase-like glycosyltransferase
VAAAILARQGILADAFYWTVSAHGVHHIFWGHGLLVTTGFVAGCLPLLLGSLAGLRAHAARWLDKRGELVVLLVWLGSSAIGTAAGARFYPHYYLQLLPPLALLAAPWFVATREKGVSRGLLLKYAWVGVAAVVFAVINASGLAQNQIPPLAQYVRAHSKPSDRIFVWGHDPSLYLEARRRPASRYILTFPLTGQQFGGALPGLDTTAWIVPGAWSRLQSDFTAHAPVYVIDVTAQTNSDYTPDKFAVLARMLNSDYEVVKEIKNPVMLYRKEPARSDNVRGGTD